MSAIVYVHELVGGPDAIRIRKELADTDRVLIDKGSGHYEVVIQRDDLVPGQGVEHLSGVLDGIASNWREIVELKGPGES